MAVEDLLFRIRADAAELGRVVERATRGLDEVDESIDRVRRSAAALDAQPVDVDVDAEVAAAMARLDQITAEALAVGALDPDVDVDAQVAGASAALAEVAAAAEALDSQPVNIDVDANTAAVLAKLSEVTAAVEALDRRPVNIDVDANTAGAITNLAATNAAIDGIGAKAAGLGGVVALGVGAAGAAITAGIGVAGGYGLAIASGNEQAQISFETMLGSAEKAEVFLKSLRDFAATTPFEFPELQTAASSLISAGVEADRVIPIMTSLGNATAGMGTGSEGVKRATVALQQMSAAGRITGEDLNQLRDAGIPVFDLLAAATGKSKEEVAALAQSGKLGRKEMEALFKALEEGRGLERFNGLMEAQSQSLAGIVSTIKDTVGQGLATAVGPAIPVIKEALGSANDLFAEFANNIGGVFSNIITAAAPAIEPLLNLVAQIGIALEPVISLFAAFAGQLAATLAPILAEMAPIIGQIAVGLGQFLLALLPLLPPIGELLVALLPILPAMVELATILVTALVPILGPLISLIAGLVGVLTSSQPVLLVVAGLLLALLGPFGLIGSAIVALVGVVAANFDTIKRVVGDVVGAVVGFLGRPVAFIRDEVVPGIAGAIAHVVGILFGLRDRAGEALGGFVAAVGDRISGAVAFFRELPGRIFEALGNLRDRLFGFGGDVVQGFIDGVRNLAGRVGQAIKDVFTAPIDAAKRLLRMGSPSRLTRDMGSDVGEGYALGLDDKLRRAQEAMAALVDVPATIGAGAAAAPRLGGAGASYGGAGGPTLNSTTNLTIGGDVSAGTLLRVRRMQAERDRELAAAIAAK